MKEFFNRVAEFFYDPLYMWIGIGVAALILIAIIVGIAVGVAKSKRKKAAKRAARLTAETQSAPTETAEAPPTEETADDEEPREAPATPLAESTATVAEEPTPEPEAAIAEEPTPEPETTTAAEEPTPEPEVPAEDEPAADEPADGEPANNEPADDKPTDGETKVAEPASREETTETEPKTEASARSAKAPVKKPTAKKPVQTVQKASLNMGRGGKWVVKQQRENEYLACLYANNGELLLESEIYATAQGAKSGIDTIKKNILLGNFGIHRDKNGNYFYKLKSGANRLLCIGEVYSTKTACENAIASVKRFSMRAPTATEIEEALSVIEYVPKDTAIVEAKPGHTGKWQIKELDADAYVACLYANNGELLLVSEDYTTVGGAKSAIETIKKNAFANNFIIDRNKAGKFCFKLRNATKSTICVGEVYEKQASVEQNIESVKRFCQTAVLDDVPDAKKGAAKPK